MGRARTILLGIVTVSMVWSVGPAAGQERLIKGEDGADMVLVPAGAFWMGSVAEDIRVRVEECERSALKLASLRV